MSYASQQDSGQGSQNWEKEKRQREQKKASQGPAPAAQHERKGNERHLRLVKS